jgi:hypothetical protein
MTQDEALIWLSQVGGRLYRSSRKRDGAEAWVAVVRSPRAGRRKGKLIIALGETLLDATAAAEGQGQALWDGLGGVH